jgi:uncharacterized protein with FMN-binding domain
MKEMSMSKKQARQPSGFVLMIKKLSLSGFVIGSFLLYLFHQRQASAANPSASPVAVNSNPVPTATFPPTSPSATNPPANPTATVPAQATGYLNGTYTGPSVDAYYGLVQVQVTIQNGKITDVKFLDYPHDRRTSQMINNQVMPWLTQEAIQAQSANVDLISGATLTSEGFVTSLQAALQSAKN